MCKVSIIIPVYNVEKYLRKCLDSVRSQTYKDIEVILVDDGSIDNSGKICDDYSKKDSRFVTYHVENGGPSRARNYGMDKATGDYITFVDSDDWLDSNAISIFVSAIEREKADVIFSNLREVNNNKIKEYRMFEQKKILFKNKNKCILENILLIPEKYTDKLIIGLTGSVCKLYRKSSLDNCKFPENLCYAEDYCFVAQVIRQANSIVYIDDILYNYRIRKSSLSHNMKEVIVERNIQLVKWFLDYYKDKKEYEILNEFVFRYYCLILSHIIIDKSMNIYDKKNQAKRFLDNIDFHYDFKKVDIKCRNRNLQIEWFLVHRRMFFLLYCFIEIVRIRNKF